MKSLVLLFIIGAGGLALRRYNPGAMNLPTGVRLDRLQNSELPTFRCIKALLKILSALCASPRLAAKECRLSVHVRDKFASQPLDVILQL